MFKKSKKLKKIPSDLISYIQIETEAIKDANDKMMISSYCLNKLDLVNWYIELLEIKKEKSAKMDYHKNASARRADG